MAIFNAAKEKDIKIIPLTHPEEMEHINTMLGIGCEAIHFRNCFMSLAANEALATIGKMIALMGNGHTDVAFGMPAVIQKEFGYEHISIYLAERDDVKEPFMVQYSKQIKQLIPAYEMGVWIADAPYPQPAHWFIFLPRFYKNGQNPFD